jgi:hypothetical protein
MLRLIVHTTARAKLVGHEISPSLAVFPEVGRNDLERAGHKSAPPPRLQHAPLHARWADPR